MNVHIVQDVSTGNVVMSIMRMPFELDHVNFKVSEGITELIRGLETLGHTVYFDQVN